MREDFVRRHSKNSISNSWMRITTFTAETSNNFAADFSVTNKVSNANVIADVGVFYNDITNIITLAFVDATTNYYTYINLDQYKTRGVNFSADISMKNF